MSEVSITEKSPGWKKIIIPAIACFGFAFLARTDDSARLPCLLIAASLPLLTWLLVAQTYLLASLLVFLVPLSVPVVTGSGSVFGFPSELLIAVLVTYLLVISMLRPVHRVTVFRHPLVILLLAEVAWMFVCTLFSSDPLISFKRVFVRSLFVYLFLVYGVHLFLEKGPRYHWLFLLYGAGLLWPVIHTYLFHRQFDFSSVSAYKACVPFFTDHTIYGACIVFVLPMLLILVFSNHIFRLRGIYHAGVIVLAIVLVLAEVLSFSRAAWISGFVAGIFGLLLIARIKFTSIIFFLLLAGGITWWYSDEIYHTISKNDAISTKGDFSDHLISVTNVQSDASNTERINRWLCAWRMALDKPVTGFGPGMYQFEYGRFQDRGHMTRISTFAGNKGHAHSEFFTQLSETGFPGFLLFLSIVLCVIGYGMRVIYRENDQRIQLLLYGAVLGLVTFYVHGIFNAFLDSDKMAVLVFGSIAVIVAADIRQRKKAEGHRDAGSDPLLLR